MKMYKWFVWSPALTKYIPVDGLHPFSRSMYSLLFGARSLSLIGLSNSFSIPMFNIHSPAKRVF